MPAKKSTKRNALIISGIIIFILWSFAYLSHGLYTLGFADWQELLTNENSFLQTLVWNVRMPRLMLVLILGAGLSAAGMTCQNLLRNDLATPGILGVITGGNFGVTLAVATGAMMISPWILPVMSFSFGMLCMLITLLLSMEGGRIISRRVMLIGIALSSVVGSMSGLISIFIRVDSFNYITAFLTSSLTKANWDFVYMSAPCVLVGWLWIFKKSRTLDVISLGDEPATSLGVPIDLTKLLLLVPAVAITGVCVAVGGGFAFLGLLAPHIARKIVGSNSKKIMLACLLIGPGLLLAAESISRWFFPLTEIPAGVFISAIGAPYFLYLLIKNGKRNELAFA